MATECLSRGFSVIRESILRGLKSLDESVGRIILTLFVL